MIDKRDDLFLTVRNYATKSRATAQWLHFRRGDQMSTSSPAKLTETEIAMALSDLPAWKLEGGKLHREYKFADFVAAFGFMTGAALVAQTMDHHPEWFNVWNTVRVDLSTHDAGGISALDVKLAHSMEELASRLAA
jgi:4a-hydroxytetrahydrobiopterin dehydratase